MTHRTFGLGTLEVRGERFLWSAPKDLAFEAAPGDAADIGITYLYEENSRLHERGMVRFHIDIAGARHTQALRLRDMPFLHERKRGFLAHRIEFPEARDVAASFLIEGEMTEEPWIGHGRRIEESFANRGEFRVVVRAPAAKAGAPG